MAAPISCRPSASRTLGAYVERLVLTGGALRGTGNDLANRITGTAGSNVLDGGAGADTLDGGAGNDVYVVDNLGDAIDETGRHGYRAGLGRPRARRPCRAVDPAMPFRHW